MIPHSFIECCYCALAGFAFGLGFYLAGKLVGAIGK